MDTLNFDKLTLGVRCRFCNKILQSKSGECQHALYYCKHNPYRRKPKKRAYKKRKCKFCGKLFFKLKRHLKTCPMRN